MDTFEIKSGYTLNESELSTDIKIAALLHLLEKQMPDIWKHYKDALDDECHNRNISPSELTLGYYIKD